MEYNHKITDKCEIVVENQTIAKQGRAYILKLKNYRANGADVIGNISFTLSIISLFT